MSSRGYLLNRWWTARRFHIGLLIATFWSSPLVGQDRTGDRAVEAGREALHGSTTYPWYDADRDAVRRIDVSPPQDLAARKSKWEPSKWSWTWPTWLTTLLEILGWLLLAATVLLLIYLLSKAYFGAEWRAGVGVGDAGDLLRGDIDRIESLPFALQRPQADLLAEARRHYEAGQFGQAIVYLYSYQLVQLDRYQLIRLSKGKTNRQYLREVRPRRELSQLLSQSMRAFEDVFFGHHRLTRDRFERCWHKLDDFHHQLAESAA